MKSRLVILALVGLSAGVVGTVGSRVIGGSETPAAAAEPVTQEVGPVAKASSTDKCQALVRKVSKTPMSDAQLKKLLQKNRECRAVVVDSKASGTASTSSPNIVTLPASASATTPSPSDDEYEGEYEGEHGDDGAYEDDDGSENEDEHEIENNNNNNFENEAEDD